CGLVAQASDSPGRKKVVSLQDASPCPTPGSCHPGSLAMPGNKSPGMTDVAFVRATTPDRRQASQTDGPRWSPSGLQDASRGVCLEKCVFAQMLERDLDAFIVELLKIAAELVTAAGAAMEELHHPPDRGIRLALDLCRAAEVSLPIEIEIDSVLK